MRPWSAVVMALALLAVVAASGGCGNAVVPLVPDRSVSSRATVAAAPSTGTGETAVASSPPTAAAAPSRPAASDPAPVPRPDPVTLSVAGRTLRSWLAGVTLPPGSTIVRDATDARGGSVTLSAGSPAAVVGHLRSGLAGAGLSIELDTASAFQFRAPGWSGQVAVDGADVTMAWAVGPWVTGRHAAELGLTAGVPARLPYPAGAVAVNARVLATGSSYDLVGVPPGDLLAFYRGVLEPFFTITGDRAENGVTTLTFADSEYDSVVTATDTSFRVVHNRRR